MLKLELPFWMQKGELEKLNNAAQFFWDRVEKWFHLSLSKFDLMTCDLIIVDHVAWERKIKRFDGEVESTYRKRVNNAFANAQDAGMTCGMKAIFKRLDIPVLDIKERQPGRDWDFVAIEMSDEILSTHKTLINLLVKTYGATCRRYEYSTTSTVEQYAAVGGMNWNHQTFTIPLPSSNDNFYTKKEVDNLISAAKGSLASLLYKATLTLPTTTILVSDILISNSNATSIDILLRQGTGANTVIWDPKIKWACGSPPPLSWTSGMEDIIKLQTFDEQKTWNAFYKGGWIQ